MEMLTPPASECHLRTYGLSAIKLAPLREPATGQAAPEVR